MKKGLLLSLALFLSLSVFAQEIQEVQMTLLTKRTATWCPLCGDYGWELFEYLIEDNSEKALLVAAHYGGSDLETTTSGAFAGNFPGGGQPRFFINNVSQSVSGSTVDAARAAIESAVNLNYQQAPPAAFGMDITEENGVYTLSGLVKFLVPAEGNFELGVFVVEKSVIAFQASQGADAEHKQILTDALTAGTLGEPLVQGTVPTDTEFPFTFEVDNPADADNIEIISILWDKDDQGVYQFVNGMKKDLSDVIISTSTIEQESDSKYGQLIYSEGQILLQNALEGRVDLDLIDMQGRTLHTFIAGELDKGTHEFLLPDHLQHNGLLILRAVWNNQYIQTQKVFRP